MELFTWLVIVLVIVAILLVSYLIGTSVALSRSSSSEMISGIAAERYRNVGVGAILLVLGLITVMGLFLWLQKEKPVVRANLNTPPLVTPIANDYFVTPIANDDGYLATVSPQQLRVPPKLIEDLFPAIPRGKDPSSPGTYIEEKRGIFSRFRN